MIGVIAAMNVEMESFREFLTDTREETVSGVRFVSGLFEGREVVTAVCGIGKVAAALCAEAMILRYQPDAVINTGVAGTLTGALSIGSIAVSTAVVQHDMDTTALGDPIGFLSGLNLVRIPADPALSGRLDAYARALGIRTASGVIASGDQFISDAAKKRAIAETFGAIACEMGGAAVGQVCYANRVPFCVLRAISDGADGDSTADYNAFVRTAAARSVKLLCTFLRG